MSYEAYQALCGPSASVADLLAMPVADELDSVLKPAHELARSAELA